MAQGELIQSEPSKLGGAYDAFSPLQIVCAWCQQHIVWHRVQTPMPFQISYSICARCYAAVSRDLAPLVLPRLDCVPCDRPERASARPA
jgi:hypothetical protein